MILTVILSALLIGKPRLPRVAGKSCIVEFGIDLGGGQVDGQISNHSGFLNCELYIQCYRYLFESVYCDSVIEAVKPRREKR